MLFPIFFYFHLKTNSLKFRLLEFLLKGDIFKRESLCTVNYLVGNFLVNVDVSNSKFRTSNFSVIKLLFILTIIMIKKGDFHLKN